MNDGREAMARARHALESLTGDEFSELRLKHELDQGNVQAVATYALAWATLALAEQAGQRRPGSTD